MGIQEAPFELSKSMATRLPDNVCIVAAPIEIDQLRDAAGPDQVGRFNCVELPASQQIAAELIESASVLVMEIDPGDPESLRRIGQVRSVRPSLPVIVALRDASVAAVRSLVRHGVNDVCALPFDFDELTNQLYDLSARMRKEAVAETPLAPLVAIVRSTGGSGATTIATHLAAALAKLPRSGRDPCLIDLDIQFGNVAQSLGCSATTNILGLLEAGDRLDAEFMSGATVSTGRKFEIIAAPDAITPLEGVDVDHLLKLLGIARRTHGSVLLDFPANWTNWTLSAAASATDIVLVTELSIAGLRQAKRRLELFDSIGVSSERIRVVVNRVERRVFRTIGVEEVRRTLGHPVFAILHAEPSVLSNAQDQGLLSWEVNRKSKFANDISLLARDLANGWES